MNDPDEGRLLSSFYKEFEEEEYEITPHVAQSKFLALPGEIKNIVYGKVVLGNSRRFAVHGDVDSHWISKTLYSSAIYHINREIRRDAMSLTYRLKDFVTFGLLSLGAFLDAIGPFGRQFVGNVTLNMGYADLAGDATDWSPGWFGLLLSLGQLNNFHLIISYGMSMADLGVKQWAFLRRLRNLLASKNVKFSWEKDFDSQISTGRRRYENLADEVDIILGIANIRNTITRD